MVLRSAASVPVYTTILGQATSPCGSLYAAATVDGVIAVWRITSLSSSRPIVRQGDMMMMMMMMTMVMMV